MATNQRHAIGFLALLTIRAKENHSGPERSFQPQLTARDDACGVVAGTRNFATGFAMVVQDRFGS
jgi:hypothetical protein